ncbi:hypothetical protein KDH_37220 [Dictyobacter sp. S3.2.2.5]|uniref:Zinc-ribbon domain-containing protein n=1 Tax=Dictyobacter halimunensis TaxID=3026934 RepID=A0ABQ6FRI8_9CHLR|nr:hypothetical protein KDH_37220 [Dictyobacter sp. S3.2.2.5]
MAQAFPRNCPRCGAATNPEQRFCGRCGLSILPPDRAQQVFSQQTPQEASEDSFSPVYPSPSTFEERYPARSLSSDATRPARYPAYSQDSGSALQEDEFSQSVSRSSPSSRRRRPGLPRLLLLIVVLVLILGVALYFVLPLLGIGKATQSAISTTDLQTTIDYAGVNITLQNVQQARNFLDDPQSRSDGMVRVHMQETNKSKNGTTLIYPTIAHAVLPGGKEVPLLYASNNPKLASGETQSTDLDFAVPTSMKANQIILRLGAADEARMDVPLQPHADVGKYATKSVDVNKTASYFSLNYEMTQATTQWSLDGQQAPKGMRYLTLTFKIDNPLLQSVIVGSPFDYMQVKSGSQSMLPQQANVPITFASHVQGQDGSAVFLVPQDTAAMSLVLGNKDSDGFDPDTVNFTI